jgi:hypothetical protein
MSAAEISSRNSAEIGKSSRGLFQSVVPSTVALRFEYPVSVDSPACERTDEIASCVCYLLASLNRV